MNGFPARNDHAAWDALATRALQEATLAADLDESRAWEETMRALIAQGLDYETFTTRRLEALRDRIKTRKREQTNIRYRYGFRHRSASLVRLDVQRWVRNHSAE